MKTQLKIVFQKFKVGLGIFNKYSYLKAFTLAEVLLTLGIIGIVAALTIPTLISNYQKTQYATSLKKAYSQMNQVLLQMSSDNNTVGSIKDYFGATVDVAPKIASYYKVIKTCGMVQNDECFAPFDNNYDGSAKTTSQYTGSVYTSSHYKFITSDGISFAIASNNDNCTQNRGFDDAPDAPPTNSVCGVVYMDVNGLKKPNNYGRDVFIFYITSNKAPMLYPRGGFYNSDSNSGSLEQGGSDYWDGVINGCSKNKKWGSYCTARVIDDGWVMNY